MNQYYDYPTKKLWDRDAWDCKLSPVQKLARWMAKNDITHVDYQYIQETANRELPKDVEYDDRLNAYIYPEVIRHWKDLGMHCEFGHAGEHWVTLVPDAVKRQEEHDPVTLFVLVDFDATQKYWSMDFITYYQPYFEMAQKEGLMLCFVNSVPSRVDLCILILREMSQRYNINFSKFYMDVSAVLNAGRKLSEVPELGLKGKDGNVLADPDTGIELFGEMKLPVINITGQWVSNDSLEFANFTPGRIGAVPFQYERLVSSMAGKKMADAMALEFDYDTGDDAGLQEQIRQMGLHYGYHEINNRGWVTIAPKNAFDQPEKKLPCMVILQEIAKSDPHSIPSAFSLWYEYLNIASMGDLMLIFFVLEDPDSNDLLVDILEDATVKYPFLDRSRVYITGHSHNGHYSMEFTRRHVDLIAGVGTMGNSHGLALKKDSVKIGQDQIGILGQHDIPLININGQWENGFSCDALKEGDQKFLTAQERVDSYQNRLRAFRCEAWSAEEILAAADSDCKAVRMLGVPVSRSEIQYLDGDECYIGDLQNKDGKDHLRLVTIENLPHATSSHMPWLTWNFLRRFSRDQATGEIVELF